MTRWSAFAFAALVALVGCEGTEGDVLSSLTGDGGVPGEIDAAGGDGDGGMLACDQTPACPPPSAGEVTVCGSIVDLADSSIIEGDSVTVRVFDLLELTTNPTNPDPLVAVAPDECGRFEAGEISSFFPGLIVITTDDDDQLGGEYRRRVASLVDADPGQVVLRNAYALRSDTDSQWATAAGLASGSFADQGTLLPIFIDVTKPPVAPFQGAPVSGVAIDQGGLGGGEDYYFTDSNPLTRTTPSEAAPTTGPNGTGLWTGGLPGSNYDGDKAGCTFESVNGIGLPAFLQAQEMLGTCK